MPNQEVIGRVSHYYKNIGVAIVDLEKPLGIGDRIKFLGGGADFEQEVNSMEANYKKIDKASPGDSIGMKVDQRVKKGCRVLRA